MPYIKPERRVLLEDGMDYFLREVFQWEPEEGDLNYLLTRIVKEWLGDRPNYARFNGALGVLTAAQLELYRRMVAPYEDTKIAANGDVY